MPPGRTRCGVGRRRFGSGRERGTGVGAADGPPLGLEVFPTRWDALPARFPVHHGEKGIRQIDRIVQPVGDEDRALGTWTSANLLDLFGGPEESAAAQRLIGSGLLAAAPTAWTGWAEWAAAGPRDKRVGLVHAGIKGLSIGIYAAFQVARRTGRHTTGARLALGAAAASGLAAYLGGHLAGARKVGSHHPAYN